MIFSVHVIEFSFVMQYFYELFIQVESTQVSFFFLDSRRHSLMAGLRILIQFFGKGISPIFWVKAPLFSFT